MSCDQTSDSLNQPAPQHHTLITPSCQHSFLADQPLRDCHSITCLVFLIWAELVGVSLPAVTLSRYHLLSPPDRPPTPTSYSTESSASKRTQMAPTKNSGRPRCTFKQCKAFTQSISGDCGFCKGQFCRTHRILENHQCEGLEDCKKAAHEANAAQLNSERTQVIKA